MPTNVSITALPASLDYAALSRSHDGLRRLNRHNFDLPKNNPRDHAFHGDLQPCMDTFGLAAEKIVFF